MHMVKKKACKPLPWHDELLRVIIGLHCQSKLSEQKALADLPLPW